VLVQQVKPLLNKFFYRLVRKHGDWLLHFRLLLLATLAANLRPWYMVGYNQADEERTIILQGFANGLILALRCL
jgi:hypothetical protein